MESSNNTIIDTLLLRYFEGKATSQEKEQVEQWIAESEENKKIAKDIYFLYIACDAATIISSTDSNMALKQVNDKIKKKQRKAFLQRFQQAAAILLMPLIGILCYFLFSSPPSEYIEVTTTSGMTASLNLPDGTKVFLNSGSTLKYPGKFSGSTRNVFLEGEGYFDVNKADEPFIINTIDDVQIEVKGTEFNFQSYPEDEYVSLTLLSGKVEMKYRNTLDQKRVEQIFPGQKVVYNKKNKNIHDESGSMKTDIAWKDGKIILQNTSLEEALKYLSRRYNVYFIIKNEKLKQHRYTGTFDNQHLFRILEYLRFSSGIQYSVVQSSDKDNIINGKQAIELY